MDRVVPPSGNLWIAGQQVWLGPAMTCPVPAEARPWLRGARPGTAQPPRLPEPQVATRRVSARGSVMVGGQPKPPRAEAGSSIGRLLSCRTLSGGKR